MAADADRLVRNRLLADLPSAVRSQIAELATVQDFPLKHLLYEQRETIDSVLFPLDGVWSLLSTDNRGRSVEVATVGCEGFVGLPVFLRATRTSSHRAMMQVPGASVVLDAEALLDLTADGGALHDTLQRYALALIAQIAQGSACNRLHSLEQRAARWILMTHDRVPVDSFPLTQEFLAQMLGTGRQPVNEVAQQLQEAGLIAYTRGQVTVLDRARLERAACECYAIIRGEFDELLASRAAEVEP